MTPLRWYYWKIPFLVYSKKHKLSFVTKPWTKIEARERRQICELVCRVYRDEKGYAGFLLTPEEVEDRYDAKAIYVLAYRRESLVGLARLVPHTSYGLQTTNWFPLHFPQYIKPKRLSEISRFIVSSEYRGGRRFVALGIIRSLFRYGRKKDLTHFLAILPYNLLLSLTRLGIPHELIPHGAPEKRHIEAQREHKALNYLKKVDFRIVLFPVVYMP